MQHLSWGLKKCLVHNFCTPISFTTIFNNFCSQLLYKIFVHHFCLQMCFKTIVHKICLVLPLILSPIGYQNFWHPLSSPLDINEEVKFNPHVTYCKKYIGAHIQEFGRNLGLLSKISGY